MLGAGEDNEYGSTGLSATFIPISLFLVRLPLDAAEHFKAHHPVVSLMAMSAQMEEYVSWTAKYLTLKWALSYIFAYSYM